MLPSPKISVQNHNSDRGMLNHMFARDPKLLWLDRNENTDPILGKLTNRLFKEISSIHCISVYPEPTYLYLRLSAYLNIEDYKIVISTGSDGVIRSIFEAYCDYGDKILITNPTYAMYEVYGLMYGANICKFEYLASQKGPILDFERFIDFIKIQKPKIIFLPNPDSPTGTVISELNLSIICDLACEIGSLIVIDEAYYPFYDKSMISYINKYENLIVIRTFSKAWGITGLRVGYGVGSENVISLLRKVRPNYETNSVGFEVATKILDFEKDMLESVERLNAGRDYFINQMNEFGIKTIQTKANFFHVLLNNKMHNSLNNIVLYRKNFSHECLKGYSRFTSTSIDNFIPIVEKIKNCL